MMHRIELGNRLLCLLFFDFFDVIKSSAFRTEMSSTCLTKRILNDTKELMHKTIIYSCSSSSLILSVVVNGSKNVKMRASKNEMNKNVQTKRNRKKSSFKCGTGFIDKIIDKLPFELHVPSYQYCGPGDYKCITRNLFREIMNL